MGKVKSKKGRQSKSKAHKTSRKEHKKKQENANLSLFKGGGASGTANTVRLTPQAAREDKRKVTSRPKHGGSQRNKRPSSAKKRSLNISEVQTNKKK
jgi:hypothetical protein